MEWESVNGMRPDAERTQRRNIVNVGMNIFVPCKILKFCLAEQLSFHKETSSWNLITFTLINRKMY
jgi:hypothetical protein